MTFYSEDIVSPVLLEIPNFRRAVVLPEICACLQQMKTFFSRKAGREVFILNVAVP
jgi:hypothetical protein